MQVPCVYNEFTFHDRSPVYVCEFINQKIPDDVQIIPTGGHANEKKSDDVVGVVFNECILSKVPRGLTRIFPYMKILSIWDSTLKIVTKTDLAEYKNIEKLGFCRNKVETLPDKLFEGFRKLEEISFNGNELELIGPNILDGLNKLKHVNFMDNPRYNIKFSLIPGQHSNATLEEVKALLTDQFDKYHERIKNVQNNLKNIQFDIKNFIGTDEAYKDLRINVNDRVFLVHKFLLAARSPKIAEILRNNPEVENFHLVDIPVETFEKVLQFLYTDEIQPDEGINFLDLFVAAGKLKIDMLKDYAAKKLIETIETENALDVFKLSNKYEHDGLKLAAFAKIKVEYPNIEFKDEWESDVKTVIKIIKAYNVKMAIMRKAEEDFKIFIGSC